MPYLICIDGPNVENEWHVGDTTVTVGRDRDNHVTLFDLKASRHHCRIYKQTGVYFLQDLGSSNGTLLRGKKITEPTLLDFNSTIQVGQSLLFFSREPLSGLKGKEFMQSGDAFDREDAFRRIRDKILAGKFGQPASASGAAGKGGFKLGSLFGRKK